MFPILIAEDDNLLRQTYELIFSPVYGYDVTSVGNGRDAARLLKRSDYQAFLIDYKMPWVDGADLYTRIRKVQQYEKTPIYFVTGFASELSPDILCDANVTILHKPCDLNSLRADMTERLSQSQQEKGQEKQSKIDIELIDSFTKMTVSVLRQVSGLESIETSRPYVHVPTEKLGLDFNEVLKFEIEAIIGSIAIMYRKDSYMWLSSVIAGTQFANLEKAAQASGHVVKRIQKGMWAQLGIAQKESAHRVFELSSHLGDGLNLRSVVKAPIIVVPIKAPFGECYAVICAKRT